jgi:hypothetical protein
MLPLLKTLSKCINVQENQQDGGAMECLVCPVSPDDEVVSRIGAEGLWSGAGGLRPMAVLSLELALRPKEWPSAKPGVPPD